MKKIIVVLIVLALFSCDWYQNYTLKYAVCGTATTANVTYLNNVGESILIAVDLPWSKTIFISDNNPIGINVLNTSDGVIDVRVFFDKRGFWQIYGRVVDPSIATIKGNIH